MAYDFRGAWEQTIGHFAAYSEATAAMDLWASRGFNKSKLVMGIPTFARGWLADECVIGGATSGPAPFRPFTGDPGMASNFELLKFVGKQISTAEGPFLETTINWSKYCYSYEDRNAVLKKMAFINERGFAGTFTRTLDYEPAEFKLHKAIV
ncbi:hypothetical protein PMAYCL1PPCAC_10316 [Pristionchus mayeri]|uniref:GH18 domain-containing protein n=1 Tax=Pristionchus mayeri TaxID=1317129 RepID=A0AAN4ZJC5_9BILA|nr:hypothetical protein PMAYCL1PPCAC_10316 [Pristionchus mayeri]